MRYAVMWYDQNNERIVFSTTHNHRGCGWHHERMEWTNGTHDGKKQWTRKEKGKWKEERTGEEFNRGMNWIGLQPLCFTMSLLIPITVRCRCDCCCCCSCCCRCCTCDVWCVSYISDLLLFVFVLMSLSLCYRPILFCNMVKQCLHVHDPGTEHAVKRICGV